MAGRYRYVWLREEQVQNMGDGNFESVECRVMLLTI
jgi:hypothetical protein